MNKKERSLANSRSEAQRIYYQRQELKRVKQELQRKDNVINELKSDLEYYKKEEELYINYQKENARLDNNWNELKKYVDKLYEDETYHSIGEVLDKINELEGKK